MPYAWHMVPVLSSTPIAGISRLLTFPNEIQTSSESFSTHVVTINQSELVGKMKVTSHLCTSTICIVFVFFFFCLDAPGLSLFTHEISKVHESWYIKGMTIFGEPWS